MKITILGEMVATEGIRLIQKEVKVYTVRVYSTVNEIGEEQFDLEKVYHSTKALIDKIIGKTFMGEEFDSFVEIDLNEPV